MELHGNSGAIDCGETMSRIEILNEDEAHKGAKMKTSVIEVHDMLSVLSAPGVEKKIGEVPGVESVTVNYAAGSATVRYDETRLNVADIKSDVRQSGYESAAPAATSGAPPAAPAPATPKSGQDAAGAVPASTAHAGIGQQDKAALSTTVDAAPKPSPAAAPASSASAGDGQKDKAAADKN
jgi:Cu2+-exporting ATPase